MAAMNAVRRKNTMKNKNGNLLTTQEVAQFLNISARTLSRWKLNRIRIGKRVYYEENLIEKILTEGKWYGKRRDYENLASRNGTRFPRFDRRGVWQSIWTYNLYGRINFPENKNFFALFVEDGILKYFPFDDQEDAEKALACFKRTGDTTQYRIVSRVIAEMLGREHEYYQYQEVMADSDADAEEARQKQQELIDFVFSAP